MSLLSGVSGDTVMKLVDGVSEMSMGSEAVVMGVRGMRGVRVMGVGGGPVMSAWRGLGRWWKRVGNSPK